MCVGALVVQGGSERERNQSLCVSASFQVPSASSLLGHLSIRYPSADPLVVTAISPVAHHT